jgi:hypothetical protein
MEEIRQLGSEFQYYLKKNNGLMRTQPNARNLIPAEMLQFFFFSSMSRMAVGPNHNVCYGPSSWVGGGYCFCYYYYCEVGDCVSVALWLLMGPAQPSDDNLSEYGAAVE